MRRDSKRRCRVAIVATMLLAASCTNGERRPAGKPSVAESRVAVAPPQLRLIVITDLQGYLEPCGCQSRPLGGIDRAAAELAAIRKDGVPTLLLAAGDLFFERETGHSLEGGDTQEIWKAEVLADILGRLEVRAALLGPADARFGAKLRDRMVERAGLTALGGDDPQASLIVDVGATKVGIWGRQLSPDDEPATATAKASAQAASLRQRGASIVIGLLGGDARGVRRLAGRAEGSDFILQAGLQRDAPDPPTKLGGVQLLTAGQHGRGLLVVDIHTAAGSANVAFADASPWSQEYQRTARAKTVSELEQRIAQWEKQAGVDARELSQQRARLARLKRETAALGRPPNASGRRFVARFIELSPEVAKDSDTSAVMLRYDRRVNEHNRTALADHKPKPVARGSAHYVGSESCADCHGSAVAWWKRHPHGHAYATLQSRHKEFNLSCVGCHVTGYEQPGGSTVTHNEGLTNVGCESCHGPGSKHEGDVAHITRSPAEGVCVRCHNAEHSDRFEFKSYVARLMVPGHGQPVAEAPAE